MKNQIYVLTTLQNLVKTPKIGFFLAIKYFCYKVQKKVKTFFFKKYVSLSCATDPPPHRESGAHHDVNILHIPSEASPLDPVFQVCSPTLLYHWVANKFNLPYQAEPRYSSPPCKHQSVAMRTPVLKRHEIVSNYLHPSFPVLDAEAPNQHQPCLKLLGPCQLKDVGITLDSATATKLWS